MKTSSNKLLGGRQLGNKIQVAALFFGGLHALSSLSLRCCCREPTVQIESYKSLKLVRNLRGIIVLAIRVIDCLDALSGCIISLWPRPGAWIGSRSKVIEKQEESGMGRVSPMSNV